MSSMSSEPLIVGGRTWVSGVVERLAAQHLDDVVAVDRVAQGLPELQLRHRLAVVRRPEVVDDVRVRGRGLRDRQVRVLLRLQAGDLLRGREGVPGHVGRLGVRLQLLLDGRLVTGLVDHDLVDVGLADRVGRGVPVGVAAQLDGLGRVVLVDLVRTVGDLVLPELGAAGLVLHHLDRSRRERRQGQHVGEVRRRLHQLDHDGAVVLGDDARQLVARRCTSSTVGRGRGGFSSAKSSQNFCMPSMRVV